MTKVLIVDDDRDILDVVQLLLTTHGFTVRGLLKGEDTFIHTKIFSPDVILLDVVMGGIDGRDICRELKSDPKTKNIPVILFSAIPSLKGNHGCTADDFLAKPFETSGLVEIIRKHSNQVNSSS